MVHTVTGTHTGEPFGFGPFEPIAATNKYVEHPLAYICVTFHDNTILRIVTSNKDETIGPAYYYD